MVVKRSNFINYLRVISGAQKCALDTETYGLRYDDRLFSISVSTPEEDYYFNFKQYPGLSEDYVLLREHAVMLADAIRGKRIYMVNAKFDMHKCDHEGAVIESAWDASAVERVIKNNLLEYSLNSMAKRNLNKEKDSKVEEFILHNGLYRDVGIEGKKKKDRVMYFDQVPFDIISKYACTDSRLTLEIGMKQEKEIPEELNKVVENELSLTTTLFHMEKRGVKLDADYAHKGLLYELSENNKVQGEFLRECGFNYDEAGMKKRLVDRLKKDGVDVPKTDKGNDSLTDSFLGSLDHPVAKLIQKIRKHTMYAGTFYGSFLYYKDKDNLIHANARQGGTETGRMSYSSPNLQQVPKEDEGEFAHYVRKCFVPRETFVMIDYDQQEYRLMLDYAGETKLIKKVLEGLDVHQATAEMLGITRKQAKQINFSLLYGSGVLKLAEALGVEVKEATQMKQMYFRKLPNIERFIQRVIRVGKQRGYIKNYMGRHCHISDPEYAYILPNHLIQGSCADIVKLAMNQIHAKYTKALGYIPMILQVHDELLFDIKEVHYDILKDVIGIMEGAYKPQNGLGLTVSVDHSRVSWAHIDKVKGVPGASRNKVQTKGDGGPKNPS